ncbi:MAG TPA: DUF177 domain-containing protein [Acidimicrobiia bacterium]|nr:DUF177 domain-containing protein [Acidimicrobiia bacterium]
MAPRQHVEASPRTARAIARDLRVAVHDVAHRPGTIRHLEREARAPALAAGTVGIPEGAPIDLDLRLEGVGKGVVVEGFVSGAWVAECSRCLTAVTGPFSVEVHELFEEQPIESETYRLEGEEIDLEPMVRDAVLLEIPPAPLCSDDCAGLCPTCGVDRNVASCDCTTESPDPRWAALGDLAFDPPTTDARARTASDS